MPVQKQNKLSKLKMLLLDWLGCGICGYFFLSLSSHHEKLIKWQLFSFKKWYLVKKTSLNWNMAKFIIEKSRGGRLLWNRNWYLSWILAGWHYWATFEASFFMFSWAKQNEKIKTLYRGFLPYANFITANFVTAVFQN